MRQRVQKSKNTLCTSPTFVPKPQNMLLKKNLFFHWMIRNGKKFIEIIERKRENQQTNAINQFTSSANNQQATGHHSQDEKNLEKRKKCVEKEVRSRTRGKMGIRIPRLAGIVESDGRGTRCSYRNNKTGARRGFRRHKKSDPSREFRVKKRMLERTGTAKDAVIRCAGGFNRSSTSLTRVISGKQRNAWKMTSSDVDVTSKGNKETSQKRSHAQPVGSYWNNYYNCYWRRWRGRGKDKEWAGRGSFPPPPSFFHDLIYD